jgi:formaldehyde-activating enzyme
MEEKRDLDGAIGEGWSGADPDGCHVNVVLGRRGGATAAALMTAFTASRPGHTPILVCAGDDKQQYEPIWPPTVMLAKSTTLEPRHEAITFGATQLGIGQGVLDAVADGLLAADSDRFVVFVSVWVEPRAEDETAVRRAARRATRRAVGRAVAGRDPEAAAAMVGRRDDLHNPYFGGEVSDADQP